MREAPQEAGPPGMFQKRKTVFKVSQKMAEDGFRPPQKTHREARWKVVRGKFIGNLAPGAGEGSLFAGHTATPSTRRCFPTSCQRTAFPPSFLLGLISGSGGGVRTCWGKENGGHFGKPLCGWVGNGEKMNSYKLISIETVSLSCWLPAGRGRASCQQSGSTIKCPLLARLPEKPVRRDGPQPQPARTEGLSNPPFP